MHEIVLQILGERKKKKTTTTKKREKRPVLRFQNLVLQVVQSKLESIK